MAPLYTITAVGGERINISINTISSRGVSYIACVMIEGTSTFLERRCSEACINTASSNVVLEFEILLIRGANLLYTKAGGQADGSEKKEAQAGDEGVDVPGSLLK